MGGDGPSRLRRVVAIGRGRVGVLAREFEALYMNVSLPLAFSVSEIHDYGGNDFPYLPGPGVFRREFSMFN